MQAEPRHGSTCRGRENTMVTMFDDGDGRTCEICRGDFDELVDCEGVLCCYACAKEHGSKLAEYRDAMDDDIRNS
jgi:hypothetical protein